MNYNKLIEMPYPFVKLVMVWLSLQFEVDISRRYGKRENRLIKACFLFFFCKSVLLRTVNIVIMSNIFKDSFNEFF